MAENKYNHRRTWDLQKYQPKYNSEQDKEINNDSFNRKEKTLTKKGKNLPKNKEIDSRKNGKVTKKKHTTYNFEFDLKTKIKVGKVNIVNPSNLKNQFYCDVCDVLKHDSSSYTCHMTSAAHMKNIGQEITVKQSSLIQVQMRLKSKKQEVHEEIVEEKFSKKTTTITKTKMTNSKTVKLEELEPETLEMNQMMGFHSFGKKSSK